MKFLKVDGFEDKMILFIDKDKKYFAIDKSEIPFDVKKGDKVEIDDEGNITLVSKR